jgi:5-methylcytosine-specific restriction endonuclease McrA
MEYKRPDKACIVCNRMGVDLHHVKTRGSGGGDESFNLMPLCRMHHQAVHAIGLNMFSRKFINVRDWLEDNDWVFDSYLMKWQHYND